MKNLSRRAVWLGIFILYLLIVWGVIAFAVTQLIG